MTEAPLWSIEAFVRARNAFDEGRGPAAAWARLNEISLNRYQALAERDGSGAWAIIVGPYDVPADVKAERQRDLAHTLRSQGHPFSRCAVHWGVKPDRVMVAAGVVGLQLPGQLAVTVAVRRQQLAVLLVAPSMDRTDIVDVATGEHLSIAGVDAQAITAALAGVFDASRVAIEYVPRGWFEGLAVYVTERRLPATVPLV